MYTSIVARTIPTLKHLQVWYMYGDYKLQVTREIRDILIYNN